MGEIEGELITRCRCVRGNKESLHKPNQRALCLLESARAFGQGLFATGVPESQPARHLRVPPTEAPRFSPHSVSPVPNHNSWSRRWQQGGNELLFSFPFLGIGLCLVSEPRTYCTPYTSVQPWGSFAYTCFLWEFTKLLECAQEQLNRSHGAVGFVQGVCGLLPGPTGRLQPMARNPRACSPLALPAGTGARLRPAPRPARGGVARAPAPSRHP